MHLLSPPTPPYGAAAADRSNQARARDRRRTPPPHTAAARTARRTPPAAVRRPLCRHAQRSRGAGRHGRAGRGNGRDPPVGRAERRPRIRIATVWPGRHGPLGLGRNGQRRVHAQVGRYRGAVHDVQPQVPVHPVVRVDDPGGRRAADRAAAKKMRRGRDTEQVQPRPPAIPPSSSASSRTARWAAGIQVGLGSPWPCADLIVHPNAPNARSAVAHRSRRVCQEFRGRARCRSAGASRDGSSKRCPLPGPRPGSPPRSAAAPPRGRRNPSRRRRHNRGLP